MPGTKLFNWYWQISFVSSKYHFSHTISHQTFKWNISNIIKPAVFTIIQIQIFGLFDQLIWITREHTLKKHQSMASLVTSRKINMIRNHVIFVVVEVLFTLFTLRYYLVRSDTTNMATYFAVFDNVVRFDMNLWYRMVRYYIHYKTIPPGTERYSIVRYDKTPYSSV